VAKSNQYAFVDGRLFELGLNVKQIAIYTAVAAHRSKTTNTAYPSHARIARMIGMSRDTVKREMPGLNHCNVWKATQRKTKGGRNSSNLYTFNDPSVWRPLYGCTDAPAPEGTHAPTSGCTTASIHRGTSAPARGCTSAPRSHEAPGSKTPGSAPRTMCNKQTEHLAPLHDGHSDDDRYADPAEAGIPSNGNWNRAEADAGEGCQTRRTKTSPSSNTNCSGSTKRNRRRDTESEGGAELAARNKPRTEVATRARQIPEKYLAMCGLDKGAGREWFERQMEEGA